MNIGCYLKSIGKTKTELAKELGLSRPTLNLYIDQFESGIKIDNERYDIIFNRLFSECVASKDLFDHKMDAVRFLLERDKKYDIGSLKPEAADMVARIHNIMVNDMSRDGWNKKVYDTIIIFLSRYRDDDIFNELSGYFSDLNSDFDLSELSEHTMAYYSYFYNCFNTILSNHPVLNMEMYDAFLRRREQLSDERAKRNAQKTDNIKAILNSKLREVELEYQENGVDISEEELLSELVRRMRGNTLHTSNN